MQIGQNTVVGVDYSLSTYEANPAEKTFVEKTTKETPLVFLFGTGGLLEEFEQNLAGKTVGDSFDFTISAENGYGLSSEENIIQLPKSVFAPEGEELDSEVVFEGNRIPMTDNEGNRYMAKVHAIDGDTITMDFNHELAGKNLHFTGTIVEVREATDEELAHGHVHGRGGHHH
jgi:FKBP-type peptidyl-prolyl cis-trans isomerase SlyD